MFKKVAAALSVLAPFTAIMLLGAPVLAQQQSQSTPNILFIMGDDISAGCSRAFTIVA